MYVCVRVNIILINSINKKLTYVFCNNNFTTLMRYIIDKNSITNY